MGRYIHNYEQRNSQRLYTFITGVQLGGGAPLLHFILKHILHVFSYLPIINIPAPLSKLPSCAPDL